MKVNIFRLVRPRKCRLPSGALVSRAVGLALGRAARGREVNVIFCGAAKIISLNRDFLGKNRITDVIAFGYSGEAAGAGLPCGDIYVCVPQGERQAAAYGNSGQEELLTLCVHGALHLSGMDDATPAQRAAMDRAAQRVIAKARA
ncbi:MAG: rRNA maturation RNase YbeY [Elusimicrobia bacterium]|nr:rRNA maturation RNase YbeY [Elusimicrobiota bacterium]